MEDTILETVKTLLPPNDDSFDSALLLYINAVFSTLTQLGVGPDSGMIVTDSTKWSEVIGDRMDIEMAKVYVALKVKLQFDPPQSSFGLTSLQETIKEYEWRLNVAVDPSDV